jgi:hypothetical protein
MRPLFLQGLQLLPHLVTQKGLVQSASTKEAWFSLDLPQDPEAFRVQDLGFCHLLKESVSIRCLDSEGNWSKEAE